MESVAYLNGQWLPVQTAGLSLADAGFAGGVTVVDNTRTYNRKLFRYPDHLARLRRDCTDCFIPLNISDVEISALAEEIIHRNDKGVELQLVTFVTPGPLSLYIGENTPGPPTFGMMTYPLPFLRYGSFFTDGVSLTVVGHQPVDETAILPPRVKHRSRMGWWVVDHLPRPAGSLPILLDRPGGTLTETAIANFLAVIDGIVTSPPRGKILDGISLRVTQDLCAKLGLPFAEREISLDHLGQVSEAMLTGTAFGLAGVKQIDDVKFDWPGPVFLMLLAAWSAEVGLDIKAQFMPKEQ